MMIVKSVTIREDQNKWLMAQPRNYNLSEKVRLWLDDEMKEEEYGSRN